MEKLLNYFFKTSHSPHKKQTPSNHSAKPSQAETGPGALPSEPKSPECKWIHLAHHRVRHLGFIPATFSQGGACSATSISLCYGCGPSCFTRFLVRILIYLRNCVGSTLHRSKSSSSLRSIQDSQDLDKGNLSLLRVHWEQQLKSIFKGGYTVRKMKDYVSKFI